MMIQDLITAIEEYNRLQTDASEHNKVLMTHQCIQQYGKKKTREVINEVKRKIRR